VLQTGQNVSAGNGPRWRFRAKQAAANFLLPMQKYGCSPFFQDGVSSIYKLLLNLLLKWRFRDRETAVSFL
jgi:hypothetical protein